MVRGNRNVSHHQPRMASTTAAISRISLCVVVDDGGGEQEGEFRPRETGGHGR
jgi:hypothetical protein